MLGIRSFKAIPADADDARCLGSDRSQLMLMMRVLGIRAFRSFTANPADADDARCLGSDRSDRSQLIQLMLMMRSAWDQIGRS